MYCQCEVNIRHVVSIVYPIDLVLCDEEESKCPTNQVYIHTLWTMVGYDILVGPRPFHLLVFIIRRTDPPLGLK